ncbi:hypothetical protein BO78DRAFT_384754 [Aspergillus sclerotiicarbonarius CBS 121057]|uniref:Uncharacterized protein n=1 Tax=Aspergillus sclerotiicarbonarius (strain CBS 121057 / IBT 28362) TaxID=1448318 RepID=A0A319EF91_ASPSB|nr:hypothetical protein BO78DRAFT_384754 [Aspergillus sclerotiicarbonarius CBS 121057]
MGWMVGSWLAGWLLAGLFHQALVGWQGRAWDIGHAPVFRYTLYKRWLSCCVGLTTSNICGFFPWMDGWSMLAFFEDKYAFRTGSGWVVGWLGGPGIRLRLRLGTDWGTDALFKQANGQRIFTDTPINDHDRLRHYLRIYQPRLGGRAGLGHIRLYTLHSPLEPRHNPLRHSTHGSLRPYQPGLGWVVGTGLGHRLPFLARKHLAQTVKVSPPTPMRDWT